MSSDTRINEWKLGLFVVGGILSGILGVGWLAANRLQRETFETVSYFDESVDGLEIGSPVKFRGVSIGRVKEISVAQDRRHVRVTTEIYEEVVRQLGLPTRSEFVNTTFMGADSGFRVQLVTSPLTGVSFVQGDFFDPATLAPARLSFETGPNTILTVPSTIKSLEQGLAEAVRSVPRVAERLVSLLDRAEVTLDEAQVGEIMSRLRSVLVELDERIRGIDDSPLVAQASSALTGIDATLVEVRALAAEMRAELPDTASGVRRMAAEAESAGAELSELSRHLQERLELFSETMAALRDLARALEREPDSILRGRSPRPFPDVR